MKSLLLFLSITTTQLAHSNSFVRFPSDFEFGLANAPAHAEDQLDDSWLEYAEAGNVKAYDNQFQPEKRLQFWTNPQIEIDLAASSGVTTFRMGVDWGRVVPTKPECDSYDCYKAVRDDAALNRYSEIVDYVIAKGMKPMITLFHHSFPRWGISSGGWVNDAASTQFEYFAKDVFHKFDTRVKNWVIFNEPSVYASLTHINGTWPTARVGYSMIDQRYFNIAQMNMISSHKSIYNYIHRHSSSANVGIAKYITRVTQKRRNPFNKIFLNFLSSKMNYGFLDETADHLDFIGINYYGKEVIEGFASIIDGTSEYSEAGRAVYPDGLYEIIINLNQKFNIEKGLKLPFWITENGISDATDILRPAYLIEHLLAVHKAVSNGIDIKGYIFWTISDNWEWADGYCPKFGLFEVDREDNFKRIPRKSFSIFKAIVESKTIRSDQRFKAWEQVQTNVGEARYICRGDKMDEGLDEPRTRPINAVNWRFSKENL